MTPYIVYVHLKIDRLLHYDISLAFIANLHDISDEVSRKPSCC